MKRTARDLLLKIQACPGTNATDLARELGVSPYVVRYWRRKFGISRPNPLREKALHLLAQGCTTQDVAQDVGRTAGTVRAWKRAAKMGKRNRYSSDAAGQCVALAKDLPLHAVGTLLGLPTSTVRLWIRRQLRELARGAEEAAPCPQHERNGTPKTG